MREIGIDEGSLPRALLTFRQCALFATLAPDALTRAVKSATFVELEPGEVLVREGESPAPYLWVVLAGEVVLAAAGAKGSVELGRLRPSDAHGEAALLLDQPAPATLTAATASLVARFDKAMLGVLFDRMPGFGASFARGLAQRHARFARQVPTLVHEGGPIAVDAQLAARVPAAVVDRFRALPVQQDGNLVVVVFADEPTPAAMTALAEALGGAEIRAVRVAPEAFQRLTADRPALALAAAAAPITPAPGLTSGVDPSRKPRPELDAMLRRVIEMRASDLHLSAGQKPRLRVDGEMIELPGVGVPGPDDVFRLLDPVMDERTRAQFLADHDCDFAYAIPGVARFRVNLFRDQKGAGSVLRQIPARILSFAELGLPPVVRTLCEHPKGLVIVTGQTGSGKSTTLASMIDFINRSRRAHIITLEDPIEFIHESQASLINQREVGAHTKSFGRALRAALREDPDIVLVGELRDLETVQLALETANTGHLVFATLHTSTAVSSIDRIIDLFPHEQQDQVRATLADNLRGVVAQTLCRRVGGGRVAAIETLVVNFAVSNLIREAKTFQIPSAMSTGRQGGNTLLNDELARLVNERTVEFEEALTKSLDKSDLTRRCGRGVQALDGGGLVPQMTRDTLSPRVPR